ncbi:MAG: membrane protein insertion efficiency factor YidD, partial [Acidobacteriota bacterium]
MKTVSLIFISLYQNVISPLLHQVLGVTTACRTFPTCSQYAQSAFREYGV